MKFTLAWLKAHLETKETATSIADALTRLGLEVEGVEDRAAKLAAFTVGHVIEAKPHPNADRLRVCLVDTGRDKVQVVCGAPNARTGMKGVFARAGTVIPATGQVLKAGVIRGEASDGMLCSAYEMGLSEDHEGIIDLPADALVGEPFAKFLGLDDPVFEVAVTPNRADCLAVRGIARDLAAAGLGILKPIDLAPPAVGSREGGFMSPVQWRIDPAALGGCPLVVGRLVRGLKNRPSPRWMQERLTAIGLRPISALVDITNFVTFDLGRPLHVFDADKLEGGDLTMRMARAGERMAALNGKTYELDPSMVVIADRRTVQGIAGVMGGEASGCTETTTSVFIESAYFDPIQVAQTGRKLNLLSDARYRFERGVDPTSPFWGADIAAKLAVELCGGEASERSVAGAEPSWRRSLGLRVGRVQSLGGIEVPAEECRSILRSLGFTVKGEGEDLTAEPPSWRADVEGEADLVEEVVRVHGLDRVAPVSLAPPSVIPPPAISIQQRRAIVAKRALAGRGFMEAVTFSFMPAAAARLFEGAGAALTLINPISADLDVMRPSILPNLLAAAKRNLDRGLGGSQGDPALFEVGPQYADSTPMGQALIAAAIRVGHVGPRHWQVPQRAADAFDAKADALAVLEAVGAPVENLQVSTDAPGWYHPGQSGALRLGPTVLAWFGMLHPSIIEAFDLKGKAAAIEVFLAKVPTPRGRGTARPVLKLSAFQPVERDFAFVLDAAVAADQVVRAAKGAEKGLISDVRVFDLYEGDRLGPGKKSLALSVVLQPTGATLTEDEIEAVAAKIVAAVAKSTGGVLRT
ncbi:MAG: phenylalanine--tRNA ligase subunit beta [Proteobacteria bacterium]|nr:phenylalanine--tRNA ligase subunit beta [Pseudomonadota bacterium]MBI3498279.1 phenylalanine--tRNA ligase subunit beta [Pseudomonadota bacterium]